MRQRNDRYIRRAFALSDLVVLVLTIGLCVSLIIVMGTESRRQGSLGRCIGQLRQLGVATDSYGSDNADLIWSFSWKEGDQLSQWEDLNNPRSDFEAAQFQAVDILRRRAAEDFPRIPGWIPQVMYNALVLADYWDASLPNDGLVCPEDENRLCWHANWEKICDCPVVPMCTDTGRRWAFSSSYEIGPAFYSTDGEISQGPNHNVYQVIGGATFGGKLMADVAYPNQKAMMWEMISRHFGDRDIYHAYQEARLSILFADGSVRVQGTAEANHGWNPRSQWLHSPTFYNYRPSEWEAPTLSGGASDPVRGFYRWTARGLAGRDFGGPEVWE